MKPCGHVVCKTCTESLVRPSHQCIVCDVKLSEKDVIELKREGKSFCRYSQARPNSLTRICFRNGVRWRRSRRIIQNRCCFSGLSRNPFVCYSAISCFRLSNIQVYSMKSGRDVRREFAKVVALWASLGRRPIGLLFMYIFSHVMFTAHVSKLQSYDSRHGRHVGYAEVSSSLNDLRISLFSLINGVAAYRCARVRDSLNTENTTWERTI